MSSSTEPTAAPSASPWPRVERLNAQRMASAIQAATGVVLRVDGHCAGGQVGAAYVTWPDGHRSVLTWRPGIRVADVRHGQLAVIGALRPAGYPAPAAELAVQAGGAVALVWELLPGAPVSHFTSALLDEALTLNDRQAGKLAGQPAVPAVDLYLTRDGPGFCLHQPLREYSPRTQALHRWITAVGESHPRCLTGDDAVHCDYQPSNILTRHGHITGVVDWDGAGRGDRRLDLVTLRFGVPGISTDPAVVTRLDQLLDGLPRNVLAPLWAHMSLRMTDWAIRHLTPDDVDHCLSLAEQRAC
jgi:aminoglycoside phosphotransferase (APT) family kinase protein